MPAMTMTTGITNVADVLDALNVQIKRNYGDEIVGCCPVHEKRTGKNDRRPSWSINTVTGLWICHSCGARGNLPQLIYEITGDYSAISSIYSVMMNNGIEQLKGKNNIKTAATPDWETYIGFAHPSDEQLASRKLLRESAVRYGIRWNSKNDSWIIPIISLDGTFMGWQEKASTYVRNHPIGVKKSEAIFGADLFITGIGLLVESPLDVVRYDSEFSNVQALASYGAAISKRQIEIVSSICDGLIIAFDNDEAGISSAKKVYDELPTLRHGVKWIKYKHTKAKDIGEMTREEIAEAVNEASVLPWWLDV